jgi:2-haloalkanoic acid dehalogenase type II
MIDGLKPLTDRVGRGVSRNEILEAHARHESSQQTWTPAKRYSDLLAVVYKRLAEEWGVVATREECVAYGESVKDWPAFADTAQALRYLKQHYKLVILSNVDNTSFSFSNKKLGVDFDAIYTAEDIGSYKPSDRNFNYMLEKLGTIGIAKGQILHTAESLFHDHVPASRLGLNSCWIHRRHADQGFGATMHPGEVPKVDFRFDSMAALAKAHAEELRGG